MGKVDLSVAVAGVKFRNPIIVGASDLACDMRNLKQCLDNGAGGVVMKTLSLQAYSRTRPCPHAFTLNHFGRGFQVGAGLGASGYARDTPGKWIKEVGPEMIRVCHDAGVPFIASLGIHVADDRGALQELAQRFEELGADMIQIIDCARGGGHQDAVDANLPANLPEAFASDIRLIKKVVSIPVNMKINACWPNVFRDAVVASEGAGASAITVYSSGTGIFVDVEKEEFFGIPAVIGYMNGRAYVPFTLAKVIEAGQAVKIPLGSSAGTWEWSDAISYLLAGAATIEVCTSAHWEGRSIFKRIAKGIQDWMVRKGYQSIDEFRGKLLSRLVSLEDIPRPDIYPVPAPLTPVIDKEVCNLCGACLSCVYGGIDSIDTEQGEVIINKQRCWGCGRCVTLCPLNAVRLVDKLGAVRWDGHGEAKFWQPEVLPSCIRDAEIP